MIQSILTLFAALTFSSAAHATMPDQMVFDSLNVPAVALPTFYGGNSVLRKSVGGLVCDKTTFYVPRGVMARVPDYSCSIAHAFTTDPAAIFNAFGTFARVLGGMNNIVVEKSYGSLDCRKSQTYTLENKNAPGRGTNVLSFSCALQ